MFCFLETTSIGQGGEHKAALKMCFAFLFLHDVSLNLPNPKQTSFTLLPLRAGIWEESGF